MTMDSWLDVLKALEKLLADLNSVQRVQCSRESLRRARRAIYYHRVQLGLPRIRTKFSPRDCTLLLLVRR